MNRIVAYEAPSWASAIRNVPKLYVQLAQRATPIHDWLLPNVPEGFKVSTKRDDMTGSILAGNKVRKLEFLLGEALTQNCNSVITCGGIQSNHCRATSLASRLLGLNCHLLLRSTETAEDEQNCHANVMLDRLAAAKVYLVPNESLEGGLTARINFLSEQLWKEKNEKAYSVPLGGSSALGTFGYVEAFQEMINQNVLEEFDDVIMAVGSGGTLAGLAVSNYLTGSRLKIHGVCVCDNAEYFYQHVDELIEDYGITGVKGSDICDIIDGYKGRGYAKTTDEEMEQLIEIGQSTGVILDPVYTLKATRGMLQEMSENPSRFKGRRVLFLHTGGYYALYNGKINDLLLKGEKTRNKNFTVWNDASQSPL